MTLVKWAVTHVAPLFIVTSPVTSYADQIWSMSKKRSSAGFSLDIPLIMLVASILKYVFSRHVYDMSTMLTRARLFYWFGARYDTPLLIQSGIMVFVQLLLLHVALLYRPPVGAQHSLSKPFAGSSESEAASTRPYSFWQWRSRRPYWQTLVYFTVTLAVAQLLVGSSSASYTAIQGYVALSVEAVLPLPQIMENARTRSCKGFRLSVLVNWIVGDVFKMTYFFLSEGGVPWAFKLCGLFQACCDFYLGAQYLMYGEGQDVGILAEKDARIA